MKTSGYRITWVSDHYNFRICVFIYMDWEASGKTVPQSVQQCTAVGFFWRFLKKLFSLYSSKLFEYFLWIYVLSQLCLTLCDPMDCHLPGSSVHGDSPGKNTGLGCHALLQGIFPTQGSDPDFPHRRWILYHLNHQEAHVNISYPLNQNKIKVLFCLLFWNFTFRVSV